MRAVADGGGGLALLLLPLLEMLAGVRSSVRARHATKPQPCGGGSAQTHTGFPKCLPAFFTKASRASRPCFSQSGGSAAAEAVGVHSGVVAAVGGLTMAGSGRVRVGSGGGGARGLAAATGCVLRRCGGGGGGGCFCCCCCEGRCARGARCGGGRPMAWPPRAALAMLPMLAGCRGAPETGGGGARGSEAPATGARPTGARATAADNGTRGGSDEGGGRGSGVLLELEPSGGALPSVSALAALICSFSSAVG